MKKKKNKTKKKCSHCFRSTRNFCRGTSCTLWRGARSNACLHSTRRSTTRGKIPSIPIYLFEHFIEFGGLRVTSYIIQHKFMLFICCMDSFMEVDIARREVLLSCVSICGILCSV